MGVASPAGDLDLDVEFGRLDRALADGRWDDAVWNLSRVRWDVACQLGSDDLAVRARMRTASSRSHVATARLASAVARTVSELERVAGERDHAREALLRAQERVRELERELAAERLLREAWERRGRAPADECDGAESAPPQCGIRIAGARCSAPGRLVASGVWACAACIRRHGDAAAYVSGGACGVCASRVPTTPIIDWDTDEWAMVCAPCVARMAGGGGR